MISIIIPAYNEEKYIEATLKAALDQDYKDFEVIVVDNNSTDNTKEVASKFKDVIVLSEKRKGTMWACERARQAAKGEIIVRLDADCIPQRDWLSKGVRIFENEKISAATGPYDYYDASPFFRKFARLWQKYIYKSISKTLNLFNSGILIGGNSFMRSSALRKIGGFNTSITFYGDDTDTAVRLASEGKVIFDNSLIMKTSARRFKTEGTVKIIWLYMVYSFKEVFETWEEKFMTLFRSHL